MAIIIGTVAGSYLVSIWKTQPARIGWVLLVLALLGTLISLRIARTPAPVRKRPFSLNPLSEVLSGLKRTAADRVLSLAVLGTTFFWFLGALLQMLLLLFGKEVLHASETQTGLLMASLAVGIGIGSMVAGRLSGDKIEPGLIPFGAFGMATSGLALAFFAHALIPSLAALAALGFTAGLFIVPLNATLQHRPQHDEKGRVLATANFVNTVGLMLASGVVWLLHEALHLSASRVIGIAAVLTLLVALYTLQLVPNFTIRFLLFVLARMVYRIRLHGKENIPQRGAALLVANHVSYVDAFLISACVQRFVRFMVGQEWYDRFSSVLSRLHAIRVPNGSARNLIRAIELAREELKKGHLVCIFAEGALTLNGNIGEFHRGLEKLVQGLDVPVIPVHLGGVWGSIFSLDRRASLWRSIRKLPFPISVSFGQPMLQPSAAEARLAVCELGADAAHAAINDHDSLAVRFVRSAKKHRSRRALTDSSGRTLTYGETLIASDLLSQMIRRKHVQERMIGIMLPASTAAAIVNLGVVLSDHVPVNLNFTIGKSALDSAIEQCALRTIITSRHFLAKAKIEQRPEMVFVEDLLSFGKLAKLVALLRVYLLPARIRSTAKADDLAAVLFSSGSTGTRKGVMLSHRNLISNTESVNSLFQVDPDDTIVGVLPLFHSFGFTYTLWFPLLNGAGAVYHPQPLDAKGLGELVYRTKATFLPAPPTFCQTYLRGCSKEQFASLRFVLVGAEKLQPTLSQQFRDEFGLDLLEGYGATEMSPVISVNIPDRERNGAKQTGFRIGSVGQPIPGVAAKVVHRESGETLAIGEEGLLLVRGPNRMLGYLNRLAETEAVLRDGWYVTGDIVVMDKDGFLRIVGRQSRFSKIGGEMVPHAKVEEVLGSITAGAACAVTAVADERRGERLVAFVTGYAATSQEIWQCLMASDLPKLWTPKADDIHLVASLPMLGTGKVDLSALRRMASAALVD